MKFFIKNKLIKETFWSFAGKGTTFLLVMLFNVYLARRLGTERFGEWAFFFSLLTVISVLSYSGINASARRYVAQRSETEELSGVLKSSVRLRFIVSLVFAVSLFLVRRPLAAFIGRPEFAPLFAAAAPLIFFAGLVEFLKQVFTGLHRIRYNFIVNLVEYGLKLLLVVFFLGFSRSLTGIVNSFTIAAFTAAVIGFYCLRKNFYMKDRADGKKDFTKHIFKYSIPLFFIGIGFLLVTEIDTLMLGVLSTDREVGLYAVAKQIIVKLPHISLAMAMGIMPVFAKLNSKNKRKLMALFYRLLKMNAVVFLVIVTILLFFSRSFICFAFGSAYSAAALPLRILTAYLVFYSFSVLLSSFLNYQGRAAKRAVSLGACMLFNIALNVLLIPAYGAVGAAVATTVSFFPYTVLNAIEVRKVFSFY